MQQMPRNDEHPASANDIEILQASGGLTGRRQFLARGAGVLAAGAVAAPVLAPALAPAAAAAGTAADATYARGLELLRSLLGQEGEASARALSALSPDLARLAVAVPYGEVAARPGLDLKTRTLCTVSSLMALGSQQDETKRHMGAYLGVGGTPRELVELVILTIAVIGFPVAINATALVRDVLRSRGIEMAAVPPVTDSGEERHARGLAHLAALSGGDPERYLPDHADAAPELARWAVEFAHGEVLSRDGLEAKAKQLAVVSMLATVGDRTDALRLHLHGALARGATREEIAELLMQIGVQAGFPKMAKAAAVAEAVLAGAGADAAAKPVAARTIVSETKAARLKRGMDTMGQTSQSAGEAVIRSFDDIAPDIGIMIVEHAYGDIFMRTGIDAKTRELTAVAAMAAVGTQTTVTPLKVHIAAALNVGATRAEIVETLYNLLPYCGYPVIEQAMAVAAEEFSRRA
ncbi:carboxymuconolactone decarboxylase family protein [Arenibaculum sp.]|uniref:carboxymuconolactone decarboxylase family protein n=1 Tax=Arenibaculum sp. TaxID=2865862 RepID=UPI002E11155B|nr:carboxymuconolactone decarboxylase family protein [Arenibaculum sp.]